jgi:large subunit ribosomal protein L9
MKVILRQNIESLGTVGEVVNVSNGYAMNYLIPRKYAFQATEGNVRSAQEEKKQYERLRQKEIQDAQKVASELDKISVTIPVQVGEEDKIFGTVTAQNVADALKEKGFDIDKRKVELEEPIKALGIYTVSVKLHQAVSSQIKVWVVRE